MSVLLQISDTHFGTEQPQVVEALVALAAQQRPDVVVLSGDITPVSYTHLDVYKRQVEARGDQLRLVPLDDSGTLIRKHFLQLDGLGVRDLHFSGDDLYILAGPTMVLNGDIRVFKWPAARPLLAANREPVRFESALTESVPLPHLSLIHI